MRRKLAELLFQDHERSAAADARTSAVAKADVSPAAKAKASSRKTADGLPVHSFRSLLADLATLTRNTVRLATDASSEPGDAPPMTMLARPTPLQQRAFDVLGISIAPQAEPTAPSLPKHRQIKHVRETPNGASG